MSNWDKLRSSGRFKGAKRPRSHAARVGGSAAPARAKRARQEHPQAAPVAPAVDMAALRAKYGENVRAEPTKYMALDCEMVRCCVCARVCVLVVRGRAY